MVVLVGLDCYDLGTANLALSEEDGLSNSVFISALCCAHIGNFLFNFILSRPGTIIASLIINKCFVRDFFQVYLKMKMLYCGCTTHSGGKVFLDLNGLVFFDFLSGSIALD